MNNSTKTTIIILITLTGLFLYACHPNNSRTERHGIRYLSAQDQGTEALFVAHYTGFIDEFLPSGGQGQITPLYDYLRLLKLPLNQHKLSEGSQRLELKDDLAPLDTGVIEDEIYYLSDNGKHFVVLRNEKNSGRLRSTDVGRARMVHYERSKDIVFVTDGEVLIRDLTDDSLRPIPEEDRLVVEDAAKTAIDLNYGQAMWIAKQAVYFVFSRKGRDGTWSIVLQDLKSKTIMATIPIKKKYIDPTVKIFPLEDGRFPINIYGYGPVNGEKFGFESFRITPNDAGVEFRIEPAFSVEL